MLISEQYRHYGFNARITSQSRRQWLKEFKGIKAKLGVYLASGQLSLTYADDGKLGAKGKVSFVGALAHVYQNAIVISDQIFKDSNDAQNPQNAKNEQDRQNESSALNKSYWFGCVINGNLIPTGSTLPNPTGDDVAYSSDYFFSESKLFEMLPLLVSQLKEQLSQDSAIKVILAVNDDIIRSQIEMLLSVLLVELEDIEPLLATFELLPKKQLSSLTLKPIKPSVSGSKLLVLIIVVGLIIGGFSYYRHQQQVQSLQSARDAQIQRSIRARQANLAMLKSNFIQMLNKVNAHRVLTVIDDQLKALTYLSQGWVLNSIDYTQDQRDTLVLNYHRLGYGNLNGVLKLNETLGSPKMDIDQGANNAKMYLQIKTLSVSDQDHLINASAFDNASSRVMQMSAFISALQSSTQLIGTTLKYQLQSSQIKNNKQVQDILVTGTTSLGLLALIDAVKAKQFVIINSLHLSFNDKAISVINQFQFKGVIYE
ncbi:type 4b pilus protein PilO2 [Cysteiniphilum halobium]|uniref:type 4b pilus protein PilO2 n=1 Tax=Cysteiniphilum halobium TaxID=2219059 RepID=UPI000E65128A|nr:type 4b pilus protein PilO2 [Cysteiniphilum halobium]